MELNVSFFPLVSFFSPGRSVCHNFKLKLNVEAEDSSEDETGTPDSELEKARTKI